MKQWLKNARWHALTQRQNMPTTMRRHGVVGDTALGTNERQKRGTALLKRCVSREMSVVMPAKYVGAPLEQPAVSSGYNMPGPNLQQIRAIVGGRRQQKQSGGFLPSIGEPFVTAVSKYIAPLTLFGIYKFINGSKTRKARKARK
jgi:hypothetical protein